MRIMATEELSIMRSDMRRPFGCSDSFLPSNAQADLIRICLHEHYKCEDRGDAVYFFTGRQVWKQKNPKELWAPVLVKRRDGRWLFLTHWLLHKRNKDMLRANSDIFEYYRPPHAFFEDYRGEVIRPEEYLYDDLGELMGGKWVMHSR